MKTTFLFLSCAALMCCKGGEGATDGPGPGDVPGARELSTADLPLNAADLARQLDSSRDRAAQPDRSTARDQVKADAPPLDLRLPDKRPPDKGDPCRSSWSLWSCLPIANGCSATCGSYGMTCMQIGLSTSCTCKHGTVEKSCKSSGTSCLMCSGAVAQGCCNI